MAELKTKPHDGDVTKFIQGVPDAKKREDSMTLLAMMQEVTGEEPRMWGPTIVGFGSYHYKYASGHEGDMCRLGFSPRKPAFSLYITPNLEEVKDLLERLGKHKHGAGCLYIKKLEDVNLSVLRELMVKGNAMLL